MDNLYLNYHLSIDWLNASSMATFIATVAPIIGLLPIPRKPIISTCAGADDKPRAETAYRLCRGAKEEKAVRIN